MRLHAALHGSRVNGPGVRSVVWLQGCHLQCPGCWNPETWDPSGGREVSAVSLASEIIAAAPPETSGITISGGEPMEQAQELATFLETVRIARPDWTVGMFTGYRMEELRYSLLRFLVLDPRTWPRVFDCLDWLVTGRYDRTRPPSSIIPGSRPDAHFVSSSNQRLLLLTGRQTYSDFPPLSVEFSIAEDGLTTVTGFPSVK